MIKVLIQSDGVSVNGRKYSKEARAKMVEQHQDKLVFAGSDRLDDVVGRVAGMALADDDSVLVEVEPINPLGEFLIRALEAGHARIYTIGTAMPHDVNGIQTVGEDYTLRGIVIEPVD